MIIGISECDERGVYDEAVVERYVTYPKNTYGILWGEYQILFLPNEPGDVEIFRKQFIGESNESPDEPNIVIEIKKNETTYIKGMYEVREFFTKKDGSKTLEIHVATKNHLGEFRIYITPESHESFEKVFEKIFSDN